MSIDDATMAQAMATEWGLCSLALHAQIEAARKFVERALPVPLDLWQTIETLHERQIELLPDAGDRRP